MWLLFIFIPSYLQRGQANKNVPVPILSVEQSWEEDAEEVEKEEEK